MKKIYLLLSGLVLTGFTFKAQVVSPGTISYPTTQTICAGAVPIGLQSTSPATVTPGTITYTWQSSILSASSGFNNIPGANGITFSPGSVAQTTYYRRAASSTPTNADYSNVVTVYVFPLQLAFITGSTSICSGYSTTLTAASGGTNYIWSGGAVSGQSTVISPTTNGVITVTIIPSTGCSVTATHNYVINALPSITVQATNSITCKGLFNSLKASPAVGVAYYWYPGAKPGSTYTIAPLTNSSYTVVGEDAITSCSVSSVFAVTVTPTPTVTATASSSSICPGGQATLDAQGALTYTWLPTLFVGQTFTLAPTSTVIYTVVGMDANCPDSAVVSIGVHPAVSYTFNVNRTKMCSKKETNLLSVTGGTAYTWLNPEITVTTPTVVVSPTITTTYTAIVTAVSGCTDAAVRTVTVLDCTGLASYDETSALSLYPNPNTGSFYISARTAVDAHIINSSGQLVKQLSLNEKNDFHASVTDLAPGMYFVISATGDQAIRQKIVVTR